MDNLMNIVKEEWTSLELVEQINQFRHLEGNRSELRHDNLRAVIKDEFEEEILSLKIQEKFIESDGGRPNKVFVLTSSQAKQVLLRESKFVRRAVIKKIEAMEKFIQEQKPKQLQFQPKELISYMIEMRKVLKAADVSDDVIAKGFAEFSENQGVKLPEFFITDKPTEDMNIDKILEYGKTAKNPSYEDYVLTLSFPIKRSIEIKRK